MKNFEVYESKIKELNYDFAIKYGECVKCVDICKGCEFISNPFGDCCYNKTKWLYEEYKKPKTKISLATKTFLENLNDKYEWIAKDKNDSVCCYERSPEKSSIFERWLNNNGGSMCSFRDVFKKELFDFLSWDDEEPTNIKELLENCEVVEDE